MQALLILLFCLVTLAILARRYGVDSRDGLDWSPPRPGQEPGPPLASRAPRLGVRPQPEGGRPPKPTFLT